MLTLYFYVRGSLIILAETLVVLVTVYSIVKAGHEPDTGAYSILFSILSLLTLTNIIFIYW